MATVPLLTNIGGKIFSNPNDVDPADFARPFSLFVPVTPVNNTPFVTGIARGLNVQTAGLATILCADGVTQVTIFLNAGFNSLSVAGVNATGLTAVGLVACY